MSIPIRACSKSEVENAMTQTNSEKVRKFFDALAKGQFPDDLLATDMEIWTLTSGRSERARFEGGVKLLASIFRGTLSYTVDTLITEGDRVAAEVRSRGTLPNGEPYSNDHVFTFLLRDARIVSVREYMNQTLVREKIVPQMQAAMTGVSPDSR
jgi:ketosteroid isomerase-like protein